MRSEDRARGQPLGPKATCRRWPPGTPAIVEDGEDPETPPADELVGDKIQRPAAVRNQGDWHRRPHPESAFAATPFAHHEPFLPVDAEKTLVVHTPVAEARAQPLTQDSIVRLP